MANCDCGRVATSTISSADMVWNFCKNCFPKSITHDDALVKWVKDRNTIEKVIAAATYEREQKEERGDDVSF